MISLFQIAIGWTGIAAILLILHISRLRANQKIAQRKHSRIKARIEVIRSHILKRNGFLDRYDLESQNLDQVLVAQPEIDLTLADQIL